MQHFIKNQTIVQFLLRSKRQILVPKPEGTTPLPENYLAAFNEDLMQCGFGLDGRASNAFRMMTVDQARTFHDTVFTAAAESTGRAWQLYPLFRNFPEDVPAHGQFALTRLMAYFQNLFYDLDCCDYTPLSCGHVIDRSLFNLNVLGGCPICGSKVDELNQPKVEKPSTETWTPVKLLSPAGDSAVLKTFSNLLSSTTSLSVDQRDFIYAVFAVDVNAAIEHAPSEIGYKENVALLISHLVRHGQPIEKFEHNVKTTTDVLRLAVGFNNGDLSLAADTKFKLSNPLRHFIMAQLERVAVSSANPLEDMSRFQGRWIRLGETLHIGSFKNRYPHAFALMDQVRNLKVIPTFGSKVNRLLAEDLNNDVISAELLDTLSKRPSEFARRLDMLLRRSDLQTSKTLEALEAVMPQVSTRILLALLLHFKNRYQPAGARAFMPKGNVAKMFVIESDTRPLLHRTVISTVEQLVVKGLRARFAALPALGKVYVAPALGQIIAPFAQRGASTSLSPLTRGSRFALSDDKGTVRLFLHWMAATDIDLSAMLFDDSWKHKGHLSWTSLNPFGGDSGCLHSGDIRDGSGPDGGCEFIDLNRAYLVKHGVRYVLVHVTAYTGESFADVPCSAGFMERGDALGGAIFDARTVENRFALTADGTSAVPMLLDLVSGDVIWADLITGDRSLDTIEKSASPARMLVKSVLAMTDTRVNLQTLFELHGSARGTLVSDAADADVVFDMNQLKCFDEVMAKYM